MKLRIDWSQFATPEFVIGTVLSGLVLGIAATYIVRGLDRIAARWSAEARERSTRLLDQRSRYIALGKGNVAGYAALASEAARLRARSVRRFLSLLAIASVLILVWMFGDLKPGWRGWLGATAVLLLCIQGLVSWILTLADDHSSRIVESALQEIREDSQVPLKS
jgi:hypothetical protein